ncbi:hypothetical protein L9F63_025374, partial [Diploptera punctata]
ADICDRYLEKRYEGEETPRRQCYKTQPRIPKKIKLFHFTSVCGNVSRLVYAPDNCSNITDEDDLGMLEKDEDYIPYNKRPETYIVPVLFALIFVVGVLGNGTLVLIFIRHRNMRNVPNTYIFSLALGDLLVIVTCVPFTSTLYTLESWPYGELICKVSECAKDVSIGVSVFTLTALSAERYCAIVNPMRRHVVGRLSTKPVTLLTAIGIWVLAVLLALPAAIFSYVPEIVLNNNQTINVCSPYPKELGTTYLHMMVLLKFLSYYAIPLCIIAFFYILMARHLELSTRNMPGEMQGQSTQIRARKKVAKMVLAFVIIFILCFLPYQSSCCGFTSIRRPMTCMTTSGTHSGSSVSKSALDGEDSMIFQTKRSTTVTFKTCLFSSSGNS